MPKIITQEQAIAQMVEANGNTYSYDNFVYTRSKDKSYVTCKVEGHGDFLVSHDLHCRLKSGCTKCNGGIKKSQEQFVEDANKRHNGKYTYKNAIYVNDKSRLSVTCDIHGDFVICASNHLQGVGCKKCAKNGYNPSKVGYLYILTSEDTTKIGITNRNVNTRLKEINKGSGKKFTIQTFITFSDGSVACKVESELLTYLRNLYEHEIGVYTGSTECFKNVDYDSLLFRLVSAVQTKINI